MQEIQNSYDQENDHMISKIHKKKKKLSQLQTKRSDPDLHHYRKKKKKKKKSTTKQHTPRHVATHPDLHPLISFQPASTEPRHTTQTAILSQKWIHAMGYGPESQLKKSEPPSPC